MSLFNILPAGVTAPADCISDLPRRLSVAMVVTKVIIPTQVH